MMPYYPARDGHPSMFELDDTPSAVGATNLHRSVVDRLFADRPAVLGRSTRGRSGSSSLQSSDKCLLAVPRALSHQNGTNH